MRRSGHTGWGVVPQRWSEVEGRAMVVAWRRSGAPLAAFARQHGVQGQRLQYWVNRLSEPEDSRTRAMRFHPVRLVDAGGVEAGPGDSRIDVVLADGRSVRVPAGFAAEDLERVLQVLESTRGC